MPKTKDTEVLEFEAALLRSVCQAVRGEYAAGTHQSRLPLASGVARSVW